MKKYFILTCTVIVFYSCSGIKKAALNKEFTTLENRFNHHVGFSLYDPDSDEMLYSFNGEKYFTPASNTKILTFYTALKTLPDSLITFYSKESGDSLILWPAGDPTFLNEEFPRSDVTTQLNKDKIIYVSFSHTDIEPFGSGWAWDDYTSYYSVERSSLPMYGNYVKISRNQDTLDISIPYFKNIIWLSDSSETTRFRREISENFIRYQPGVIGKSRTSRIPFKTSNWLSTRLLSDTLNRPVYLIDKPFDTTAIAVKSIPIDTAYKKMMQESNNFVAEQLLIQCGAVLFDTLNSEQVIDYSLENYLKFLPQKPNWVDASGLSRYNLITPNSLVALWAKIYEEYDRHKIFPLLAAGGEAGTIKNYYKADPPYIYGKTGTLRNNHLLSGYLITASGKVLIFSFMNNNYPESSTPVKRQMEEILWEIHLNN